MLGSYLQNSVVGMNKAAYFEMCEALGSEPLLSEVPVELDDFAVEVQEVLEIYSLLQDNWDTMGGSYLGKHLSNFTEILKLSDIDPLDYKCYLVLVRLIDVVRSAEINKQKSQEKPSQ